MAAYTVNSFASILPDPRGKPSPQSDLPRAVMTAVKRRNLPGYATANRFVQAEQYIGTQYVAIDRVASGLAGSSIQILKRNAAGAAALTSRDATRGKDWVPEGFDHPAVRLFEHINPVDTLHQFLTKYFVCKHLFGLAYVYVVLGRSGKPVELWTVPPQYVTPQYAGPTAEYPFGAYRLVVPQPMSYGFAQPGQAVIDARQMLTDRRYNPRYEWDGLSPLTACGLQIDLLRAINESRKEAMDKGIHLDGVVTVEGASEAELDRLRREFAERHTGTAADRVLFSGGESVKAAPLTLSPKDMSYADGYQQLTDFVCALFGVPPGVVGMTDAGSYAAYYAALQQFRGLKLQPEADEISEVWTKHLIRPHWGRDLKLVVELPPLVDQEDMKQRYSMLLQGGGITVNEERAAHNLEPDEEDGDVPMPVYLQIKQQKAQPQPALPGLSPNDTDASPLSGDSPQPEGGEADEMVPNGDTNSDTSVTDPGQDAISGAVLQALGVQGGDGANTDPGMVRKAWTRFTTRTGGVGARNEQGREIYGADAEAALAAQSGGAGQTQGDKPSAPGTHRVSYTVNGKPQVADVPAASPEEAAEIVTKLGGVVTGGGKPTGGGKASKPKTPRAGQKPQPAPSGEYADRTLAQSQAETKPVEHLDADELESEWDRLMSLDERRELDPDERERFAAVKAGVTKNRAASLEEANKPITAGTPATTGATSAAPLPTAGVATDADPLPPKAIPIAKRAIPVLKPAAAKLGRMPEARAAAKSVHEWGPAVAERHAAAVAAANNLDQALAHDLILHLLEHLVRAIPGVGRAASLGVGLLRRHRLHQAAGQVRAAAQQGGDTADRPGTSPRPEVAAAMRQARQSQGVSDGSGISRSGPKRPKVPGSVGSLPPRLKSLAVAYARKVNKSLKSGGQ